MLDKLQERRRDAIWSFLITGILMIYFIGICYSGQFLLDNGAPFHLQLVGGGTAVLLGCASLGSAVFFVALGAKVLITGGTS